MDEKTGRVLIVDDDPEVLTMMRMTLGIQGYEIITAENGREALRRLRETSVDTVVLDLDMPVMGGIETIEHLRATPTTRSLPVLVVTGAGKDDERIVAALNAGANDFLCKPCDPAELLQRIGVMVDLLKLHQERSKAVRQMAGAASHLLSQPLTSLLGNLEIIMDHLAKVPEPAREHFRRSYKAATEMAEAVKRIQKVEEHYTVNYIGDDEIVDLGSVGEGPARYGARPTNEKKRVGRAKGPTREDFNQ